MVKDDLYNIRRACHLGTLLTECTIGHIGIMEITGNNQAWIVSCHLGTTTAGTVTVVETRGGNATKKIGNQQMFGNPAEIGDQIPTFGRKIARQAVIVDCGTKPLRGTRLTEGTDRGIRTRITR